MAALGEIRPDEVALGFDPGERPEAAVTFIGHIRSPWSPQDCPKNLRAARDRGGAGTVEILPAYRPGLAGLTVGQAIVLLYWVGRGRRDLIVQHPAHLAEPRGVFSIRSPVRPNPIALAAVTVTALDAPAGRLEVDAIDCFDGTPVLDIKPWLATIDMPPGQG